MSQAEATLPRSPGPVDSSGLGLLVLLTAAWTLFLLPALAPVSLRDGCRAASCVAAIAMLAGARTRTPPMALPGAFAQALLGLALALASYPAWIGGIGHLGRAFGLSAPPAIPPVVPGLASGLTTLVLGPFVEELLYRDRVLPFVARRAGASAGILVSTSLFALTHVGAWMVLVAAVAGVALGALRAATGGVAAGVGLHAGLNLGGLAFGAPPVRHPLDAPAACLAGALGLTALLLAVRSLGRPTASPSHHA